MEASSKSNPIEKMSIFCGDCNLLLKDIIEQSKNPIIVTDPPFNIGYHYNEYDDNMPEEEYYAWLSNIFQLAPSVIIHYPENLYRLAFEIGKVPDEIVSWVYPSNMNRQHRDIVFYGVEPDFRKVRQPYRENSAKTRRLMAKGTGGARIYDWWEINQVKNTSREKTAHPCQMPLEVMKRIVGILPDDATIIDPFMGSGTTGVACRELNREFVGIELNREYFEIAKKRIYGQDS